MSALQFLAACSFSNNDKKEKARCNSSIADFFVFLH